MVNVCSILHTVKQLGVSDEVVSMKEQDGSGTLGQLKPGTNTIRSTAWYSPLAGPLSDIGDMPVVAKVVKSLSKD